MTPPPRTAAGAFDLDDPALAAVAAALTARHISEAKLCRESHYPEAEQLVAFLAERGYRIEAAQPEAQPAEAGFILVGPTEEGTTTLCPLVGVHVHAFRGPHRFHEWDPDPVAPSPQTPMGLAL
jgi:hypothetical protein